VLPFKNNPKDVVLVPGGCGTATIAFDAVNPGKWLFHCHFEFHMQAGMITTIEYANVTIPPEQGTTLTVEQNDSAGVSVLGQISGFVVFFLISLLL
jgi:FtsP/CotA-like multicopper oxidase with cupredoxin domain